MASKRRIIADCMLREARGNPWKIPYSVYLQTSLWNRRRQSILSLDRNKCIRCSKPARDVHHKNYRNLGREKKEDLISLCGACHLLITSGSISDSELHHRFSPRRRRFKQEKLPGWFAARKRKYNRGVGRVLADPNVTRRTICADDPKPSPIKVPSIVVIYRTP